MTFGVTPTSIAAGQSATLSRTTTNALSDALLVAWER